MGNPVGDPVGDPVELGVPERDTDGVTVGVTVGVTEGSATQESKVTLPLAPLTPEDTDPPTKLTSPTTVTPGPM